MAGLLDFLDTEEGRFGLSLLAAAGPTAQPMGFGQRLAGALQMQDQFRQQQAEAEDRKRRAAMQEMQMTQLKTKAQEEARAREAAARKMELLPGLFTSTTQGEIGVPQSGGVPMFSQGAQVTRPSMQTRGFDVQRAIAAGYSPEEIKAYAELNNIGRQKVARTVEGVDAQGRPVTYQVDEYGQRVGDGIGQWKAPMAVNQGNRISMIDPASMQSRGTFDVSMSPAERDAAARGWAGQNLARERFNLERQQGGKPTFNADAGGFIIPPSQNNPQGGVIPLPGFQKPLNDVQSKALLFGSRMQEADKLINDLATKGRNFSTPGANSGWGIVGAAVNMVNSEQGQMLDQAKRDFVNAVLRRESGAAIAESEFDNAQKQYFPQIGDSPKVIEQKARNRALAAQGVLAEVPKGTPPISADSAASGQKRIVRTGVYNGKKVVQYSDGSTEYAD